MKCCKNPHLSCVGNLILWGIILKSFWSPESTLRSSRMRTKMPQKKINKHFGAVRGRRSEKKDSEEDKKKPKRAP